MTVRAWVDLSFGDEILLSGESFSDEEYSLYLDFLVRYADGAWSVVDDDENHLNNTEEDAIMAKFCTNCGKPLPESGICDCQANAADQEVRKEVACDEPVRAAPAGDAQTPQEAASEQDLPETASESEQTEAATGPRADIRRPAGTAEQYSPCCAGR